MKIAQVRPEARPLHRPHQAYLDKFAAQVIKSCGWQSISPECLATLTELISDLIFRIGKSASKFCQHGGRSHPSFHDVQCSIAELGLDMTSIQLTRMLPRICNLAIQPPDKLPTIVKIAAPLPQPPYIPDHLHSHPFPQPHTYIRTPTYSMPVSSYTSLREARARQRNDVLNSISKQVVSSGASSQLIPGREDSTWASPCVIEPVEYLITHPEDMRVKKKKRKTLSNNIYLQPPKCSWAGLFAS